MHQSRLSHQLNLLLLCSHQVHLKNPLVDLVLLCPAHVLVDRVLAITHLFQRHAQRVLAIIRFQQVTVDLVLMVE